ncbi:hypothetical protein V5799_001042 [Amblyomma americanum]|uniref:Receptor ligand binding region domain-containing protein n=1 Tax=Amblyomma americanum TaxID=6943 RepID=A0AAQ4D1B0_AMBAM
MVLQITGASGDFGMTPEAPTRSKGVIKAILLFYCSELPWPSICSSTIRLTPFTTVGMAPAKPAAAALLLSLCLQLGGLKVAQAEDPSPAIYPGQANIALLMPLRTDGRNGSTSGDAAGTSSGDATPCGSLDPRRVRLALAGVWAAQQANFRKAPSDFNLGVYLYDTCGRDEVALRQSVRVIHQAGHVRSMACPSTRVPPVFGAILQGEPDAVETAAKTLDSFSIPAVAARDVGADSVRRLRNLYSTAPSANSLARALASTLLRLGWSYVAAMSSPQDRPRELSRAFQKVARDMAIDIMSADAPPAGFSFQQVQESLGSTRQLVESGCRAAALFVTPAEAKAFLVSYEPDPDAAFSWVLVTPGDVTASLAGFLAPHKLRRLRHVLFAAPDDGQRPAEYGDYLRDLIDRDGSAPLLQELRKTYSQKRRGAALGRRDERQRGRGGRHPRSVGHGRRAAGRAARPVRPRHRLPVRRPPGAERVRARGARRAQLQHGRLRGGLPQRHAAQVLARQARGHAQVRRQGRLHQRGSAADF